MTQQKVIQRSKCKLIQGLHNWRLQLSTFLGQPFRLQCLDEEKIANNVTKKERTAKADNVKYFRNRFWQKKCWTLRLVFWKDLTQIKPGRVWLSCCSDFSIMWKSHKMCFSSHSLHHLHTPLLSRCCSGCCSPAARRPSLKIGFRPFHP